MLYMKYQTEFYKVKTLKGTKKTKEGFFVDRPFCPCCNQYVDSLMEHLRSCKGTIKQYGNRGNY